MRLDLAAVAWFVAAATAAPANDEYEFVEAAARGSRLHEPISDKVTTHSYETMYAQFLLPLRAGVQATGRRLKILEIGMGCDMPRGSPGASTLLWTRLLPDAEVWQAERDSVCAKALGSKLPVRVLVGDQADPAVVRTWVRTTGGGFHAIIDDGGHLNDQIRNSFDELWPALLPGGVYFIEDLHVSRSSPLGESEFTIVDRLHSWSEQLLNSHGFGADTEANHRARLQTGKHPLPSNVSFVFVQLEAAVVGKHTRAGLTAKQAHRHFPDVGGGPLHDTGDQNALATIVDAYRRAGDEGTGAVRGAAQRRLRRRARGTCRYKPSPLEVRWSHKFARAEAENRSLNLRQFCSARHIVRWPEDASTMSCSDRDVRIPPLVGALRSPMWPCTFEPQLQRQSTSWDRILASAEGMRELLRVDHIHLDPASAAGRPSGAKAFLLDLGSSLWRGGGDGKGEVGFAATKWLIARHAELGVVFDRVLAWEAIAHPPADLWDGVPLGVAARASLYNVPASGEDGHPAHPWSVLKQIATPEDLVVVKLDIDNDQLESTLIEQLLTDSNTTDLVDVLFFEPAWRRATTFSAEGCSTRHELCVHPVFHRTGKHPLSAAYTKFTQLRSAGILAHPWV